MIATRDLTVCRRVLADLPHELASTRHHRGESLRVAARKLGVSHVHLMRLESGTSEPQLHTIELIIDYLQNGARRAP